MTKINTIIFDLGGVLLNLDQERTMRAFQRLGADLEQINIEAPIFKDIETGAADEQLFRKTLIDAIRQPVIEQHLDDAWNAMLLDLPLQRIEWIEQLRKQFKIGLLSNTNSIHIRYFHNYLQSQGMYDRWHGAFDHILLSYEMGLRKPDLTIYHQAAEVFQVGPEQILFIDDSPVNIKGAKQAGLNTLWAKTPFGLDTLEEIRQLIY